MNTIRDWFSSRPLSVQRALIQQGFNEKEGQNIAWLVKHQHNGKLYGMFAGAFLAFAWGHWYHRLYAYFPILRVQSGWKFGMQLSVIFAGILAGDYLYTARRYGANHILGNALMWNNNLFYKNKEDFVQSFQVLNRAFEPQQIELFNQKRQSINQPFKRKWIYNPQIETPEEFERRSSIAETKTAPWKIPDIVQKIKKNNAQTSDLVIQPFKSQDHFDSTGFKHNMRYYLQIGWSNLS